MKIGKCSKCKLSTFSSLQPLLTPEAMGKVESQATSGYIAVKSTIVTPPSLKMYMAYKSGLLETL